MDYNKKSNKSRLIFRKIILSRFVLALLFIIFIFSFWSSADIFLKSRKAYKERKEVEQTIEELKEKKKELERKLSELETEKGIERELINKFQIKKPGEEVLVIMDAPSKEGDETKEKAGFFGNVWQSLKNIRPFAK